jgi:hypothetical protein
MKTVYYLALTLLILSCQTKPKQETETTAATGQVQEDSLLALTTRPGPDAPRTAADRLVRALYFEHNKTENPFREKKDRTLIDQYFAKPIADLIWSDAQKSAGKVNRVKINLLFNAPDTSIKKTWVLPAAIGGSKAVVYVTFTNDNKPGEIRVELQQTSGRWRITEMIYPDGKRLTGLLG